MCSGGSLCVCEGVMSSSSVPLPPIPCILLLACSLHLSSNRPDIKDGAPATATAHPAAAGVLSSLGFERTRHRLLAPAAAARPTAAGDFPHSIPCRRLGAAARLSPAAIKLGLSQLPNPSSTQAKRFSGVPHLQLKSSSALQVNPPPSPHPSLPCARLIRSCQN